MTVNNEKIKKDVIDQLYWDDSVDSSNILVEVKDDKVHLTGTVPSFASKLAAYRDAMVPGVNCIENNLHVEMMPTIPSLTDGELKTRTESTLKWNLDIIARDITVEVKAGKVTLKGHVDTYWRKKRAEELVSDILGVSGVENMLSVVPTRSRVDKAIADDIKATFARISSIDMNKVEIKVEKGVVTLSGTVPTWSNLLTAEDTARFTAGVIDVINNLSTQQF